MALKSQDEYLMAVIWLLLCMGTLLRLEPLWAIYIVGSTRIEESAIDDSLAPIAMGTLRGRPVHDALH